MFQAPALLAGQIQEIGNEVFGDGDFVAPALKKQHELRLGNPMRIDTEGLFAVNRFGIGLNPVASLALTKLLDLSHLTSESVTITTTSGQNLDEFAQANGLENAQELFDDAFNREKVRKEMPELHAAINKDRFSVDFADFTAPSDIVFHIPNTGAIRSMFDDVLFPFGATNDLREMYLNYAPSSMQQVLRSFGVREDSDTLLGVQDILRLLLG